MVRLAGVGLLLLIICQTGRSATPAVQPPANVSKDSWWSDDKITHAIVGFTVAGFSTGISKHLLDKSNSDAVVVGISVPLSIGLAKEWYDSKHPRTHQASLKDLVAGCVGAAIGTAFVIAMTS
jgi:uncharacterized protein YfiM (DUF2279 family)